MERTKARERKGKALFNLFTFLFPFRSHTPSSVEPVVNRFAGRRKSVFAEQYDPEDDDEDNNKVIFPKTDEQRTRLSDSVKNILLFRAIDPEQVNHLTSDTSVQL